MRVIAGLARGHKLKATEDYDIRPTPDRVRESVFNMLSNDIYGSSFLDIFGGSGAVGIEALSRGADFLAVIEKNKKHCKIIEDNISHVKKALGEFKFKLINSGFEDGIRSLKDQKFDIIFMDPPYDTGFSSTALKFIYDADILNAEGIIVVEQKSNEEEPHNAHFEIVKNKRYGITGIYFLKYKQEV